MRSEKPTKLQLYSFVASMPLIDTLLNYILYDQRIFRDINIWLISFPLIFIIGIASWRTHVLITNYTKRKYPDPKQISKRLLIMGLLVIPFMSASVALIFLLYSGFDILGYEFEYADLKAGLLVGLSINLVFESLYEAEYLLEKYKESMHEKQTFQVLSVAQEFDALKNQVNPHFLFNCFNTLSSLITEDKQKAEIFLDELSKVYRYLLRNNEDGMSTVEKEIKFINSYYRLLQTRHGEAVKLNIHIDKKYENYLLPSLSLQLLVENVVKHNILSKNDPQVIDIFTTAGNKLVVNNNLKRRTVKAPSNRVGLENIKAKYLLLKQAGFQVMEDEKNFTVVLPLIWNNPSAENQHEQKLKIVNSN